MDKAHDDGALLAESRDGMRILWDTPIPMDDGLVLRADVFLPERDGRYPVIMTMGPYGKNLSFQEGYPSAWNNMVAEHPDVAEGSTNAYQAWETADPEKWTRDGYAMVRVDSRGAGRSPGVIDHLGPRETQDFYTCIEWAAAEPWSTGKVGLNGISYYAANQWQVSGLKPPHLAAMCIWEGFADFYRDASHHGGILNSFWQHWADMQVSGVQHGVGEGGARSRLTGRLACGPETLSAEELRANRLNLGQDCLDHALDDQWHRERSARWELVETPFLSAASLGGQGLHPRGNYEGFMRAKSSQKWLEIHGLEHWTHFMTDYGVALQKRFFGHFLKGEDTGWDTQPKVQLNVRRPGEVFTLRAENEWPLARTSWTKAFLHPTSASLSFEEPTADGSTSYGATGDGARFFMEPFSQDVEICGPIAAKLHVSSSTADADLFLVLGLFDPNGKEVVWKGTTDPHTPLAQGWLRASHRKLDADLTRFYRPYHTHDVVQPLTPGVVYELDIEIWPTGVVAPAGYRLCLTVRGRDYEWDGPGIRLSNFKNLLQGCGPFLHDDPRDRRPDVFDNTVTIHTSPGQPSYVLLPVIP